MSKRTFRITRYKINVDKKGSAKLKASKNGYICKERDVMYLENLLDSKHKSERSTHNRADKAEKTAIAAMDKVFAQTKEINSIRTILVDAKELVEAYGTEDGALIERINAAVNPTSKWKRIWAIITL